MRVLVTFALKEEFAPWRKRGGFEPSQDFGNGQAYRTRQGDIEVGVVLTAVGPANATRVVARVLEGSTFDLVISSGLAGGLRPMHRPGQVLVGRKVRRLEDGQERAAPARWLDRARELGAREGVFVTSARVAGTGEEKRSLAAEADAIEMESFAVIEQATARGIPAVAIRAIGDPVENPLPVDFNRVFDAAGRLRPARLAGELIRRPGAAAGLVRLARQSGRAATALAEFLDRYVAAACQGSTGKLTITDSSEK